MIKLLHNRRKRRITEMMTAAVRRTLAFLFLFAITTNGFAGQFFVICIVDQGESHIDVLYDNCCLESPRDDSQLQRATQADHSGQCADHGECLHVELNDQFLRQAMPPRPEFSSYSDGSHSTQHLSPIPFSLTELLHVACDDLPPEVAFVRNSASSAIPQVLRC